MPTPRRRRGQSLERVLGPPALFATAYGLTPVVFVIAGLIFAATAATYAEGTVRYPEAGGSSSFARHGFNELVSFEAAWAQILTYVATIAISAFFVPHYLSIFWEPLRDNPWDIVGGAIVIVLLVALNIVGIQESARINVFLAVVDFATQVLPAAPGSPALTAPDVASQMKPYLWGVGTPEKGFAIKIRSPDASSTNTPCPWSRRQPSRTSAAVMACHSAGVTWRSPLVRQ